MPKISVCIPAYNRDEQLSRCIASIKNQDFKDYEIVIGEHPVIAIARNFAARKANGELLVFVDADVVLNHNALSHYYNVYQNNKDILLVGMYHWLPPTYPVKEVKGIVGNDPRLKNIHLFNSGDTRDKYCLSFYSGNFAISKKLYFDIGEMDEKMTGHGGEDCEFAIRLQKAGHKAIFMPEVVGFHIYHDRNQEKNESEAMDNIKYIAEKHNLDELGIRFGNIKDGELPLVYKEGENDHV